MSLGWAIAATQLAVFGYCPNQIKGLGNGSVIFVDVSSKYCLSLNVALALAYAVGTLFALKGVDGLKDQYKKEPTQNLGNHIMFARGSWKD
jgi:hypothetical protein